MANHKSAEKRARQSERRRERNRQARSRIRTLEKGFRAAVAEGNPEAGSARLRDVEAALRRAAAKGLVPKRRASRRISRMAKRLHQASAPK
ncbi:30S ribosomal protein S20 [Myxococcaceae bacterium]|nr:30S ribosomal protein S20 [Myxococcaceae bacterium]